MNWKKIALSLIRYHYQKKDENFEKICEDVEKYLNDKDEIDLYCYIFTLRTKLGCWVPMEGGE